MRKTPPRRGKIGSLQLRVGLPGSPRPICVHTPACPTCTCAHKSTLPGMYPLAHTRSCTSKHTPVQRHTRQTLTHACAHTGMVQVCSLIPSHNYLLSIYYVSVMMVGSRDEAINRQKPPVLSHSWPGRGPSQGMTLPLGPEQNSEGQAGETCAHPLPQAGLGKVAVCTRNLPLPLGSPSLSAAIGV